MYKEAGGGKWLIQAALNTMEGNQEEEATMIL